ATVHDRVGHLLDNRALEPVTQHHEAMTLLHALGDRQLRRARETDGQRDVLRTRTPATILLSAGKEWLDHRAAPHEHRAAALRCADFMTRNREKVEGYCAGVDFDLPERLNRVGVKEYAARACRGGQVLDWLDRADLVVHPHHGRDGDLA